jgi:predicted DNA-binding transcriptional regulator YafY
MPTVSNYAVPTLTPIALTVLQHLQAHQGRAQGISAAALAQATGLPQRTQRSAISLLREAGQPVVGTPESGYYLAQNADEVYQCCAFLRSRSMHSLVMEARLLKLSLPALVGQIAIELI